MQRTLFLHVGTHKTGTTSFQKSLVRNEHALRTAGLRPILWKKTGPKGNRRSTGNHAAFSHAILRDEVRSGARVRGSVPNDGPRRKADRLDRIARRVATAAEPSVVISTEALCFLRTDEEQQVLRDFLAKVDREVRVLITFRAAADWRRSWLGQLQKMKPALGGVSVFDEIQSDPEDVRICGDWYFDQDAIRAFWSPFDLTELTYEAEPNMVTALYREMGIDHQGLELDTDIYANQRRVAPTESSPQ